MFHYQPTDDDNQGDLTSMFQPILYRGREMKMRDLSYQVAVPDAAPNWISGSGQAWNWITRGTDFNQRIGRMITIKRIICTGSLIIDYGAGASPQPFWHVTLGLVLNTETNSTQPAMGAVINGSTLPLPNPANFVQYRHLWVRRFKIESADLVQEASSGTFVGRDDVKPFHFDLHVNIPVLYNTGTDSSIASIVDNSIGLWGVSQGPVAHTALTLQYRIQYVDE